MNARFLPLQGGGWEGDGGESLNPLSEAGMLADLFSLH